MRDNFKAMKAFNDTYVDEPDGAFFALAEEMHGWDVDDWAWFSDECAIRETYPVTAKGAA